MVRLKSGGPVMTVQGPHAANPLALLCKWFTDESAATVSHDGFVAASLQLAKPDRPDDAPADA